MSSALRNFLVVFFLSLLGFGILGHIVATTIVPEYIDDGGDSSEPVVRESSETASYDASEDEEQSRSTVQEGEKFNFAFFCIGSDSELAGIYIVHVDSALNACVRVRIPGYAAVEHKGAQYSLAELYDSEGKSYILNKLYYLTGCRIDEYVSLCAVDESGNGRDLTQLSTYMNYTYKLVKGFDYPNPNYGFDGGDASAQNAAEVGEYIQLKPGSYALNGVTEGLQNDAVLLDTRYNENAFDIYADFIERMLSDKAQTGSLEKQRKIFDYMSEKSFSDYESSGASRFLFGNFQKSVTCPYSGRFGAWDEIRKALRG